MSRGSLKQGFKEFLRASPSVLTRLPASTDASACSRFASSWALPRSALLGFDLLVKKRVLRDASVSGASAISVSPTSGGCCSSTSAGWKVLLNLEILLHLQVRSNLQVSSRLQPRRHAVLPNVPWSRTLVSWTCTPSYDCTLSTSPNAPFAAWRQGPLLTMSCLLLQRWFLLSLKDFAANQ